MKKTLIFLVVILVVILFLSSTVFSADESSSSQEKFRLGYTISVYDPLNRTVDEETRCVNTTLTVALFNKNTRRPINNGEVTAYLNFRQAVEDKYTDYTGVAYVPLRYEGIYVLRLKKTGYTDVRTSPFNVTICTNPTTTSTTTSTAIEQTTTTEPVVTTTTTRPEKTGSYVTATTVAQTCEDGVMNQDEENVDCGGVCGPCSPVNMTTFVLAVLLIGCLGILIFLVMKLYEKKKAEKKHSHHKKGEDEKGNGGHKDEHHVKKHPKEGGEEKQ